MEMREQIFSWLRRRRERTRRIAADADMLIHDLGPDAYAEARLMQRKATSADERRRWRDTALAIARKTDKRIGHDTATRMSPDAELPWPGLEPRKLDPIDELKRLIRK